MNETTDSLSCKLSSEDAAQQLLEWKNLRSQSTKITKIEKGYQLKFPSGLEREVVELAAKESDCCEFLQIETVVTDFELMLRITSESKRAAPIMMVISGAGV